MEKKTTQRIMGGLVILSVVIIALPLFFSSTDSTAELASAKMPPPFEQPKEDVAQPLQSPVAAATPTPPTAPVVSNKVVQNEDNSITITSNQIDAANQANGSTAQPTINTEMTQADAAASDDVSAPPAPAPEPATTVKKTHPKKLAKAHSQPIHKLAWVVQMGSFKNKENARRLTDHLRAAGFKAFTHTVKMGHQERIHVFVGPEYQQASAVKLSTQVTQHLKMQGIILPYKPLEL